MRTVVMTFVVSMVLCAGVAIAGGSFSQGELDSYLNDLPQVASYMEKEGAYLDELEGDEAWAAMRANDQFMSFLNGLGWEPERFMYVMEHVSLGIASLQVQEHSAEFDGQMEESRRAIMADTSMSDDMKQQLLAQMEQSVAQLRKMENPEDMGVTADEMELLRANKDRVLDVYENM